MRNIHILDYGNKKIESFFLCCRSSLKAFAANDELCAANSIPAVPLDAVGAKGWQEIMAAEFTGEEILELTTGRLAQGMMPDEAGGICSDTRFLKEGEWFVALPGRTFDGHDFLGEAFSCGALGCIVEERGSYPIAATSFPLIAVDNTYDAYQQLARNWRKRLNPRVIAVTGSPNQPSTILSICERVLSSKYKLVTNESGDVCSIFADETGLEPGTQLFLSKVCPPDLRQAELLGRALAPTIAVLSEEGFSHLRASDEAAIARAECDLLAHLEKVRGVGVISKRSQHLLHRIRYHFAERVVLFDEQEISLDSSGQRTAAKLLGIEETFSLPKDCDISDAWSVLMVCKLIGMNDAELATALSRM